MAWDPLGCGAAQAARLSSETLERSPLCVPSDPHSPSARRPPWCYFSVLAGRPTLQPTLQSTPAPRASTASLHYIRRPALMQGVQCGGMQVREGEAEYELVGDAVDREKERRLCAFMQLLCGLFSGRYTHLR